MRKLFDRLMAPQIRAIREFEAQAWEQGYLLAHYQDRSMDVEGRLDLEVPEWLEEELNDWNPYRG